MLVPSKGLSDLRMRNQVESDFREILAIRRLRYLRNLEFDNYESVCVRVCERERENVTIQGPKVPRIQQSNDLRI